MKKTGSEIGQFAGIAQRYAERTLKGRLLEHTFACAETAGRLALRFGLDADKAMAAGYLHDVAKPARYPDQIALARELGMLPLNIFAYPPPVLHGPLAALIAKEKLGIEDPDILQAIECHSTGCSGMGPLAKVIFVSDFIEFTRVFPGAAELRSHGHLTLEQLSAAILARKLEHLLRERRQIDPRAIEFWNDLVKKRK